MVQFPSSVALILDADGHIGPDVACDACGYSLHTLATDARCPECGQDVAIALQTHLKRLRYAQPRWVRGLATGVLCILLTPVVAIVAGLLGAAVSAFIMLAVFAQQPNPSPTTVLYTTTIIRFLTLVAVIAPAIAGILLLTRREPSDLQEGLTARRALRISVWLLPLPIVLQLLAGLWVAVLIPPGPNATPPLELLVPGIVLGAALTIVSFVIYVIAPLVLLRHLANLLRRIPRPGLVRYTRIVSWSFLVLGMLTLIGSTVATISMISFVRSLANTATTMTTTTTTTAPTTILPATFNVTVTQSGVPATIVTTMPTAWQTTTMPATMPATMPVTTTTPILPPTPPGLFTGMALGVIPLAFGSCGISLLGIAVLVLLILVCQAFYAAARDADQTAARLAGGPAPPTPNPQAGTTN